MKIQSTNYLTIQGWMRTELNLYGNDLLVYAVIYSFSQDKKSVFTGSLQYLADWCGATKQGISKNLKNLLEKGLIEKNEDGYFVNETVQQSLMRVQQSLTVEEKTVQQSLMRVQQSLTNNISNTKECVIDNKDNKKEGKKPLFSDNNSKQHTIEDIYNLYLQMCPNLPKARILNDKRKNAIYKAYKNYGVETIKEIFTKANSSSFLRGKNDRGWKADIEWVLGDHAVNILEGKYDDHKGRSSNVLDKPWERNVKSVAMTKEEREAEEREADRLEAQGRKARF